MSVKIMEFAVPHITEKDQRDIHRGYVEFFKRRGVDVGGDGFRNAFYSKSRAEAVKERQRLAALFAEEKNENEE